MADTEATLKSTRRAAYQKLLELLKEERKKRGVTQEELAKRLGKPQSYVSKIESGERRLDIVEYVEVVAKIGGDPVAHLKTVWVLLKRGG